MMRVFIFITMLMACSVFSHADEIESTTATNDAKPADEGKEQGTRSATRAWLDMQRSGQAASGRPQPLSGDAMDKIHERYINSFGNSIPEYYDHAVHAIK